MSVSPSSFAFRTVRALFQKDTPLFVPMIQQCREFLSCCPCEREGDAPEFFASLKLRTTREPQGDGLQLMELAELHWDVGIPLLEQRSDALASVDDEGLEAEPRSLKHVETGAVMFHLLARDLFPVQIPAVGTTHQKTIRPGKERRIHEEIHWPLLRDDLPGCRPMRIEVFPERLGVFAVRCPEIVVGLSSRRVIVIRTLHPSLFPLIPTNENVLAVLALISLAPGLPTISPKRK